MKHAVEFDFEEILALDAIASEAARLMLNTRDGFLDPPIYGLSILQGVVSDAIQKEFHEKSRAKEDRPAADRLTEHSRNLSHDCPPPSTSTVAPAKSDGVPFSDVWQYRDAVGMLIASSTGGVMTIEEMCSGGIYDAMTRGIRESIHAVVEAEKRLPEL